MKTHDTFAISPLILGLVFAAGCSTFQGEKTGQDIAVSGPTVIDARTNPATFELNNRLQPVNRAEIYADVKDFNSEVSQVKLRFLHVPLEIPMEKVAGTTWRAVLSPEQLKTLAVSGQTMRYQANVIATNENGQVATSPTPLDVAVKAPDPSQVTG